MAKRISETDRLYRIDHLQKRQTIGMPMLVYSKEHDLNYNNFKHWCNQYKEEDNKVIAKKRSNNFIPIHLDQSKALAAS
jgi:hypothetical protein